MPAPRGSSGDSRRPVRVLVADGDPLARRAVHGALAQAGGFDVVADASDGVEALELALRHRPDVVVMEIALRGMDGISVTRELAGSGDGTRVVMFSASDDEELVLLALTAGASGYLSKEGAIDALPRTLRGVADGEAAVSRAVTMRLIDRLRALSDVGEGLRPVRSPLTPREWEVLDRLSGGDSTQDIARALVLSPDTVYSHVKNILRKLGVHTRADAVAAAEALRRPGAAAGAEAAPGGRAEADSRQRHPGRRAADHRVEGRPAARRRPAERPGSSR